MKHSKPAWWRNSTRLPLIGFLAIAGYFIWVEHEAHIRPYLTWILLIGCLLLHGFMHGGHGHGSEKDSSKGDDKR
jgi:hypothetical protein